MINPDRYLIEKVFQEWSDGIYRKTGKSCYTVAAIAGCAAMVGVCLAQLGTEQPLQDRIGIATIFSLWFLVRVIELFRAGLQAEKKFTLVRLSSVITEPIFRLLFVGISLYATVLILGAVLSGAMSGNLLYGAAAIGCLTWVFGTVCMHYFAACIPRPPKQELQAAPQMAPVRA